AAASSPSGAGSPTRPSVVTADRPMRIPPTARPPDSREPASIVADRAARESCPARWCGRTGAGQPHHHDQGAPGMATDRIATTVWTGDLMSGSGEVSLDSSGAAPALAVSWPSRAEEANGKTSPEELIAAAHATCYSM